MVSVTIFSVVCTIFVCIFGSDLALCESDEDVEMDKHLYDAIEKGDLRSAKQMVQSGANIDSPHKSGFTALHIAAAQGHLDLIKYLVEQKIDINAKNGFGRTALQEATLAGKENAIQLLIDLGADITSTDYTGQTPCHEAANSGNLDLLKILIKYCDIEARDNWNRTALYKAVEKGHLDAVKYLLENEADPYVTGLQNSNLMHVAAENGHTSTVLELGRYKELINAKNALEDTPLYYALDGNHSETVYALIDLGAEIQSDYLWKALVEFNYEIIKFLIKKTGDVNARYPSMEGCGNTILMDVVGSTRYKPKEATNLIRFLLDRNADVNLSNCDNLTALHVAAINKADAPLLNLLLDKGADINAEDSHGDTPLALALGQTAEILRKLGARITKEEM